MGGIHREIMLDFGGGGYNMFGGYGNAARAGTSLVNLEQRANQIHGVLPKITQTKTTTAVGEVLSAEGNLEIWARNTGNAATFFFRIVNASTNSVVLTQGISLPTALAFTSFTYNNLFTVSATGTYRIEFFRTGNNANNGTFLIDDVLIQSDVFVVEQTVCVSTGDDYRFGFNGQEKDNEVSGEGNSYTAEFWQYDPRLGRRWNIDPLTEKYPDLSPYLCFINNPIRHSDVNGDEASGEGEPINKTDVTGQQLSLPSNTIDIVEYKTSKIEYNCNKVDVQIGSVQSFTIGESNYSASFDDEGVFKGYFDQNNKQYTGEEVFDNLSFLYKDYSYNENAEENVIPISLFVPSSSKKLGISKYENDIATTRLVKANVAVGLSRLFSLLKVNQKGQDIIAVGIALTDADNLTVNKRNIAIYEEGVNWYGNVFTNVLTGKTYSVVTGTSNKTSVITGTKYVQYQLMYKGKEIYTWSETLLGGILK